ncbi:MAG: hypothetical protein HY690_09120 [Chloroflexi bacterium]|nr:hypothetical protein [Chloroflexota bacterium]
MDKAIVRLGTVLLAGFVVVALALGYWQVAAAPGLVDGPYNPRLLAEAARTERGRILDRTSKVLVDNAPAGQGSKRVYALPAAVHVTGYFSPRYGAAGLEQRFDDYLSGARAPSLVDRVRDRLLHERRRGSDLVLTLDARVQAVAAEALGERRGAIVALDPRSGAVLALASAPGFDPNTLDQDWSALQRSEGDPFFNRALQATYTPGSTFKIVTATAAVDLGLVDLDQPFACSKPVAIDLLQVDCRNNAHVPNLTFQQAFAWSSNRTFALAGLALGFPGPMNRWLTDEPPEPYPWKTRGIAASAARLEEYAGRFGFGRSLPFDLPVSISRLKTQPEWTADLLGQTAFGQGQLAETPLQAALSAAAIANGGRLPAPYLVAEARGPDGTVQRLHEPGEDALEQVMSPATAARLQAFMVESVERGYAGKAALVGVQVAGKTGTAEVGAGRTPHAWFVGYAPADKPVVAVAAILEHQGSGSDFAAPAAREVLAAALRR